MNKKLRIFLELTGGAVLTYWLIHTIGFRNYLIFGVIKLLYFFIFSDLISWLIYKRRPALSKKDVELVMQVGPLVLTIATILGIVVTIVFWAFEFVKAIFDVIDNENNKSIQNQE